MRIRVANDGVSQLNPGQTAGYLNYPLLLAASTKLDTASILQLLQYSPKTVNTVVQTSIGQSQGMDQNLTQQQSVGSSYSQTNSYSMNVSGGFFGDDATGSAGYSASSSDTYEHSQMNSTGSELGRSSSANSNDSMSIKDWGAYASVGADSTEITWVYSQEYPWNPLKYRWVDPSAADDAGAAVDVPDHIIDLLFQSWNGGINTYPLPPSEIALFGVDFTSKVSWLVPATEDDQPITCTHSISYFSGSHWVSPSDQQTPNVSMDEAPLQDLVTSPMLDLTLLGLDPVTSNAADNGAVTGFLAHRFILPPPQPTSDILARPFAKIISGSNNLLITSLGFYEGMRANVTSDTPAELFVKFKVADPELSLSLFMKHWKTSDESCLLTFEFNSDATSKLTLYVDAAEGEGAANNLSQIQLRNKSYASIDYHDFIVQGLNTVHIWIEPATPGTVATYVLRALALGDS